jgi:hypothetical protein
VNAAKELIADEDMNWRRAILPGQSSVYLSQPGEGSEEWKRREVQAPMRVGIVYSGELTFSSAVDIFLSNRPAMRSCFEVHGQ